MPSSLITNIDIKASIKGTNVNDITLDDYVNANDADIIGIFGDHPTPDEIRTDAKKARDASRRIRALIQLVLIDARYKPELWVAQNAASVSNRDYWAEREKALNTIGVLLPI